MVCEKKIKSWLEITVEAIINFLGNNNIIQVCNNYTNARVVGVRLIFINEHKKKKPGDFEMEKKKQEVVKRIY